MGPVSLHSLDDSQDQLFKITTPFPCRDYQLASPSHSSNLENLKDTLPTWYSHSLLRYHENAIEHSLEAENIPLELNPSFHIQNARLLHDSPISTQKAQSCFACARARPQQYRKRGILRASPSIRSLSMDRFITEHSFIESFSSPIRYNKSPRQLTRTEKLFRRRDRHANPFTRTRRPNMKSESRWRSSQRRGQSPYSNPHLVNDTIFQTPGVNVLPDVFGEGSIEVNWEDGSPSVASIEVSESLGGLLRRGTTAPTYIATFLDEKNSQEENRCMYEGRLAFALDIDLASRVLRIPRISHKDAALSPTSPRYERYFPLIWRDNVWKRLGCIEYTNTQKELKRRAVPSAPFRILDAPLLRDDYYSTPMAFCYTTCLLAVGLGGDVYLWSEAQGIEYSPFPTQPISNAVTSLSFSSAIGLQSILAVGRHSGQLSLWSTFELGVRFSITHPEPVSCVSFKQTLSRRPSLRFRGMEADVQDLVVGDITGTIWYYCVEWPSETDLAANSWDGAMTLLVKVSAHTAQVCGLCWSPDDIFLATGGDDNLCLLFDIEKISNLRQHGKSFQTLRRSSPVVLDRHPTRTFSPFMSISRLGRDFSSNKDPDTGPTPVMSNQGVHATPMINSDIGLVLSGGAYTTVLPYDRQRYRLLHSAAVKAIAFAPWQHTLLATGGGVKDGKIHFFHAPTGISLATIDVHAQVTSLIWSRTKREIAATFGYAQPDHHFRIAVFAWPSCEQIIAIPWNLNINSILNPGDDDQNFDPGRAIWAIAYPAGPNTIPRPSRRGNVTETLHLTGFGSVLHSSEGNGHEELDVSEVVHERAEDPAMPPTRAREGKTWNTRTTDEGSIIVAASDETIRFYEIWSGSTKKILRRSGLLGGSEILEGLEGLESPGKEIIR